jgi:hypothetical protein
MFANSHSIDMSNPLKSLWHWLMASPTGVSDYRPGSVANVASNLSHTHTVRHHPKAVSCRNMAPAHALRPLRMVRVMEAGQPASQVGRMVISGRMADVCAELDRLAAFESHLS